MPAPQRTFTVSEHGLVALAAELARVLQSGDVIALAGDLGAGKTTFARALVRALVEDDALDVPSPTFSLRQDYASPRGPVVHFDLYRIHDPRDLDDIDFDEALQGAITIIEWPERAGAVLPVSMLTVTLADAASPEHRHVTLTWPAAGRLARLPLGRYCVK